MMNSELITPLKEKKTPMIPIQLILTYLELSHDIKKLVRIFSSRVLLVSVGI